MTGRSDIDSVVMQNDVPWFSNASADLLAGIRQRHANVNLVRTLLLARLVRMHVTRGPSTDRFLLVVARFCQASPGALAAIMMTPAYTRWARRAEHIAQTVYQHGLTPDAAVERSGIRSHGAHDILTFLDELGCFDLELAILTRIPSCGVAQASDGIVHLGFWGIELTISSSDTVGWKLDVDDHGAYLHINDRSYDVLDLSRGSVGAIQRVEGVVVVPRFEYAGRVMLLTSASAHVQLPPSKSEVPAVRTLRSGLESLASCWPSMLIDAMIGLHQIEIQAGSARPGDSIRDVTAEARLSGDILTDSMYAAEHIVRRLANLVFDDWFACHPSENGLGDPGEHPTLRQVFADLRVAHYLARYTQCNTQPDDVSGRLHALLDKIKEDTCRLQTVSTMQSHEQSLLAEITRHRRSLQSMYK